MAAARGGEENAGEGRGAAARRREKETRGRWCGVTCAVRRVAWRGGCGAAPAPSSIDARMMLKMSKTFAAKEIACRITVLPPCLSISLTLSPMLTPYRKCRYIQMKGCHASSDTCTSRQPVPFCPGAESARANADSLVLERTTKILWPGAQDDGPAMHSFS